MIGKFAALEYCFDADICTFVNRRLHLQSSAFVAGQAVAQTVLSRQLLQQYQQLRSVSKRFTSMSQWTNMNLLDSDGELLLANARRLVQFEFRNTVTWR